MSHTDTQTLFIDSHRQGDVLHVRAPSNIALIKYMGKKDATLNIPSNPSLSYTSPTWYTDVWLSPHTTDCWAPKDADGLMLSEQQQQRYLKHWAFLKAKLGIEKHYQIQSDNNFPAHCGLASSASSFAALTAAAALSTEQDTLDWQAIANLSRQGSGSSCRSFFGPWVLWDHPHINNIPGPLDELIHHVILIDDAPKKASSSKAHACITSSPHYPARHNAVQRRLEALLNSFEHQDWGKSFQLIWDEFIQMHQLFETAKPAFGYLNDDAKNVLEHLKSYWQKYNDGPWVTVDAGPNIHLLFRPEQQSCIQDMKNLCSTLQQRYLEPHD